MKIHSAHIKNFKLLEDVELHFSVDSSHPLTVIRAENGSGKTSVLQALRWAMYGERGLSPRMRLTSTAKPLHKPVQVQVRVEFTTTDPYSGVEARYRLIRTCEEVPEQGDSFSRTSEKLRVLQLTEKGDEDIEEGKDGLISAVLPLNLADVFFTNGDDVQQFIAGGPHSELERQEAVHKAIRHLLGLEDVETVEGHLNHVAKRLRRELTSSAGKELKTAEEELVKIEDEIEKQRELLISTRQRKAVVEEQIRHDERALDAIKGIGRLDEIQRRIQEIEDDIEHLEAEENNIRQQMKLFLQSEDVSRLFLGGHLSQGLRALANLEDKDVIPGTSIEVLRDRLQLGFCICGEELRPGHSRHIHVKNLIQKQQQVEPRRQRLIALWHDARNRVFPEQSRADEERSLSERAAFLNGQFTDCLDMKRRKYADLKTEQERREQIDEERVQLFAQRLRSSRTKLGDFNRKEGSIGGDIQGLEKGQKKCKENFDEAERQTSLNKVRRRRSIVATDLLALTNGTLDRLKSVYVQEVSGRMNELFLGIVGADPDAQATVFKGVSINERYDIVIHSLEGKTLDADTELNGASQRALTLSFIWSLMEVAKREAPRIIDTPLGMTSGAVKQRMVETLTEPVTINGLPYQVILFMTRSEIRDIESLIEDRAGIVTTLTCSSDYPVDLINDWGDGMPVIRACECDHNEICRICERRIDANRFTFRRDQT